MSVDNLPTLTPPPDQEALLEILRRSLPPGFYEQLEAHESFAVFRALAAQWAALARSGTRLISARYYLPHALQRDAPASSGVKASGEVTLIRDGVDNQPALVVEAGQMKLVGPGGRIYQNVDRVVWNPGDTGERTATFECEIPGFVGNLDFLGDSEGLLDLDLVDLQDQDHGRTSIAGSITAGLPPQLWDSGISDVFLPEDVGLYVEIVSSAVASNVGKIRRVEHFAYPEVESPPGSGRYPRRVLLDPRPRANPVEILREDNSAATFTNLTGEATSETTGDLAIFPAVPAADDALYFGYTSLFDRLVVDISTAGVGTWGDLVWEYWDGAAWSALTVTADRTDRWRVAGEVSAAWTIPVDWATVASPSGSGLNLYYVRARVSSVTTVTTAPVASRIVLLVPDRLVNDAGAVTWKLRDFDDLGVQISECEAFAGGRDNDLWVLGDERGVYQQVNESDDVFRQRAARLLDVVSPNAIRRAIDRILSPYGYHGDAIDVQDGLGEFFMDVDALDYYSPGDDFPTEQWKMPLSFDEAYGFFLVLVPYLGLGEFGCALDDSPLIELPDEGGFLDNALDFCFGDGYPVGAAPLYAAIWNSVNKIKAGGVNFDMTRSEELSVLTC